MNTPQGQPQLSVVLGGQASGKTTGEPEELKLCIDFESEASIISSVLNDETLLDEVRPFLKPVHIYSEAHMRMYEACCWLRDAGKPIDIVTMATRLRDTDRLGQVGGMPYITTLINSAPALSSSRIKAYAISVRDKAIRRDMKLLSYAAKMRATLEPTAIETIIEQTRAELDKLTLEIGGSEKDATVNAVLKRTANRLGTMSETKGKGQLPSGYDRLDRILGGLSVMLMILAARPGMGKTSLATGMAVNVAGVREEDGSLNNGVYFSSMETFDEEAMMRLWCAEARVSVTRARTGMLTKLDWEKLFAAAEFINALPMWIDDEAAQSVAGLWAKCRRADLVLKRKGKKLKLVVADYLQLMKAPRPGMKREEIVAENARMLVAMANDLQCCVVALSQLNRECEKRPNKRPMISDLRESGEIEQAARAIVFIYRDEYYDKKSKDKNIAELIVAKQNNGPTGTVRVRFDGEYTRFDNLVEGEFDDDDDGPPPPPAAASPVATRKLDMDDATPAPRKGRQTKASAAQEAAAEAAEQAFAREAAAIVVDAITPGMSIVELRRVLGEKNGMSEGDVERFLAEAYEDGSVRIDGVADERVLWRKA